MPRQKITTCLWFDNNAEEAATFYVSVFRDGQILSTTPGPGGSPLVVEFTLAGTNFLALNGGPHFQFSEAISLSVDCTSQTEVDELWIKLSSGGSEGRCGWLKDRYGLSWQIVPSCLPEMLADPDPEKRARVVSAFLKMSKLDIAAMKAAFESP